MAERIYKSVEELIGRTPLMEIRNIEKEEVWKPESWSS